MIPLGGSKLSISKKRLRGALNNQPEKSCLRLRLSALEFLLYMVHAATLMIFRSRPTYGIIELFCAHSEI